MVRKNEVLLEGKVRSFPLSRDKNFYSHPVDVRLTILERAAIRVPNERSIRTRIFEDAYAQPTRDIFFDFEPGPDTTMLLWMLSAAARSLNALHFQMESAQFLNHGVFTGRRVFLTNFKRNRRLRHRVFPCCRIQKLTER